MQARNVLPINRSSTQAATSTQPQAQSNRAFRRPLEAILEDLRKPIPDRFIKLKPQKNTKTGKTTNLKFASWYDIIRILEVRAPGFEYDCSPHFDIRRAAAEFGLGLHLYWEK